MFKLLLIVYFLITMAAAPVLANTEVDVRWYLMNSENVITAITSVDLHQYLTLNMGIAAHGKMENKMPFTVNVQQLGIQFGNSQLRFFAGKQPISIATAQINPVFLHPSGPAFPNVGYSINYRTLSYSKIYGDLSTDENYKRVGIHYLKWQPTPRLSMGIGEAVVFSHPFDGDLYFYTLPLLPYYFAKYMPGIPTSYDNTLFYGDGIWHLPWLTLYGELLVNEFPMTPTNKNPKLYAITLGMELETIVAGWDLLLEYSHVTDQAYSNAIKSNIFSYGDDSLGHPIGDDLTAIDARLSKYISQIDTDTYFGVYYQRLGNISVTPWINEEKQVTPEQEYGVKLGFTHQLNQVDFGFDLQLGWVSDYQHQENNHGYRTSAVVRATWQLP